MSTEGYNVVGVCGYGNSGASAIMDLLRGCDEIEANNKREWQILHNVDGILDLKHYLVECRDKVASNTAIHRFERSLRDYRYWAIQSKYRKQYIEVSQKYVDKLKKCIWNGYSFMDGGDVLGFEGTKLGHFFYWGIHKVTSKFKLKLNMPPAKKRYFSLMSEDEFNSLTKEYITELFETIGYEKQKTLVLEQFFVFSNPILGHEYFDSAKTILVERDPRDVYASSIFSSKNGAPAIECRFMPLNNVENFVEYFKRLHIGCEQSEKVMIVKFENLIYDYENTVKQLCDFLNVNVTNDLQKFFHPEISINNTKVYKKHPEISKEIQYIEEHLSEYLNSYVD